MFRLLAFGFMTCDAVLTLAVMLCQSFTLMVVFASVFTSLAIALLSGAVRSTLYPSYFWDEKGNS